MEQLNITIGKICADEIVWQRNRKDIEERVRWQLMGYLNGLHNALVTKLNRDNPSLCFTPKS